MTTPEQPSTPANVARVQRLREIPSVSAVIATLRQAGAEFTDEVLARAIRLELDAAREALLAGDLLDRQVIEARIVTAIRAMERPRLAPVINATGVVIHTNLGRAPVSAEAADAMR